jgi:hypothetical protein
LTTRFLKFRTLTFYSRPEEQIQEHLCIKKSATSLSAAIGLLGSPLTPRPKKYLATDLYSSSTPIAIIDKSNHRISFNILKKFVTSLSAVIGALGSTLGPHPERDLATDLYSVSTPLVIIDEFDRQISFNGLKKFVTSLSAAIRALGSPLGPRPERDLAIHLYSGSTPISIKMSLIAGSVSEDFKKATTSL